MPLRTSWFCRLWIVRSLPGMILALKMTVSPASSRIRGCWPPAIRDQGAARLALAAGAQIEHLLARQQVGFALIADRRDVLQVADLARRIDHPPHRAADHDSARPAARPRSIASPSAPRWRRSWSARPGSAARRSAWSGSRAPRPRSPTCRAKTLVLSHMIASTPSLPELRERRLIGPRAHQRRRVELPVAGVQQPRRAASRSPARWHRGSSG